MLQYQLPYTTQERKKGRKKKSRIEGSRHKPSRKRHAVFPPHTHTLSFSLSLSICFGPLISEKRPKRERERERERTRHGLLRLLPLYIGWDFLFEKIPPNSFNYSRYLPHTICPFPVPVCVPNSISTYISISFSHAFFAFRCVLSLSFLSPSLYFSLSLSISLTHTQVNQGI